MASKQDAQGSVLIDVQSDQDKAGSAEPGAGTFAMPLIAKARYIRQATRHYDMRERVIKEKVVVGIMTTSVTQVPFFSTGRTERLSPSKEVFWQVFLHKDPQGRSW